MTSARPISASCNRSFPAYHTSGKRNHGDIHWVVMHDEEAPNALSAALWFRNPDSGGSAHLCVDDNECYRCLDDDHIPWGAASTFGANTHGFHIEQAGYAAWKAWKWKKHMRLLKRSAFKAAQACHRLGIPVRFVTAPDLLMGISGITTHNEISKASRMHDPSHAWIYSHSDPGKGWPRRLWMRLVRKYFAEIKANKGHTR